MAAEVLVDAAQSKEIAGTTILHVFIEQRGSWEAERLSDGSQCGAYDLVAAQRRRVEAVLRMFQHPGLQRIDLLQRHREEVHIAAGKGAMGKYLVVAALVIGALGKANQVKQRTVDMIFVGRSRGRRTGEHVGVHDDVHLRDYQAATGRTGFCTSSGATKDVRLICGSR